MNQKISLGLSYDDVLLIPQHSKLGSRSEVNLETQITPRVRIKLPIISINMSDVTGVEMAIAIGKLGGLGFLHRFNFPEEEADMVAKVKKAKVFVGAAIGIRNHYMERAEMLVRAGVDILTLDIAHAAMQGAIDATSELKRKFGGKVDIVSGVVATYEGASDLFKAGADSVRVGVGPGTICLTRTETGVGVPQITALLDCVLAAKKFKKTILCDGGTKNSGDIVKGLATGASAAIVGSQLAGHDEAPGKLVIIKGKKYKQYNASTSFAEKKNHTKKLDGLGKNYINHIEGTESYVAYKGALAKTIQKMEANLRAGYSYCGAKNISQLWQNAKFIQITAMGLKESGPHDVITKT